MSELPLWKRCRVLACPGRLRMLDLLNAPEPQNVTMIAGQLGISLDVASKNLQLLAFAEFLNPDRQGKYLFYTLNNNAPLLQSVLKAFKTSGEDPTQILRMLTALTHERRVALVSILNRESADLIGLCRRGRMSKRACERHIDKLVRREWVAVTDEQYSLSEPTDRFGRALLQFTKQDGTLAQVCR